MASDILESMAHVLTMGINFSISVSAESEKEADKIFSGLSGGGKVSTYSVAGVMSAFQFGPGKSN